MARHTYSKVQAIVTKMIDEGKDLRSHFEEIDKILHSEWEVPKELDLDWVVPVKSSDPASAFFTAERALSIEEPEIFITQTTPGAENQDKIDEMEKWMKWQYKQIRRRNDKDPYTDKVHSGLRYDIICGQVININHENEGLKKLGKKERIIKAGTGDFAIRMANPKNVYVRKDIISGLQTVLHVYQSRSSEIIGTWGKKTNQFAKAIGDEDDPLCTVYDYTSTEQRMVYVKRERSATEQAGVSGGTQWKIIDEAWKLNFLNWFWVSGGTNLEEEGEFQVNPLLGRIARTGLWDLQNIMETLVISEAVATAGYPRFGIVGPNGDMVEVIYHDPARLLNVPDGHTIVDLRERRLDEGMLHLSDRVKGKVDRETVARFLQNLDLPDRAAYASINAIMQAAVSALDRYKRLTERALAEMFQIMFWYIHARKETSVGFASKGEQVGLGWDTFDPEYIFIEVECMAKTPSDYMQKINAGRMMLEMGIPLEDVLKFVGFNNPKDIVERKAMETLQQFELGLRQQEEQAQSQMRTREMMLESEMRMRQKFAPPQPEEGGQMGAGANQPARPGPDTQAGGMEQASDPMNVLATQEGQDTGGQV